MDSTQLSNIISEINSLPTFIRGYDTSVANYLSGVSPSCQHFLEIISNLENDETFAAAYALSWAGQGSAYGLLTDFMYTVFSIHRNRDILSSNRASYYSSSDTEIINEGNYASGEAAKLVSFIQGNGPSQGVMI